MIAEKRSLKKITMTAGIVAMTVGLINSFSFEANAASTTGGYITVYHACLDSNGHAYASYTTCGSGSGKCISISCPPEE